MWSGIVRRRLNSFKLRQPSLSLPSMLLPRTVCWQTYSYLVQLSHTAASYQQPRCPAPAAGKRKSRGSGGAAQQADSEAESEGCAVLCCVWVSCCDEAHLLGSAASRTPLGGGAEG